MKVYANYGCGIPPFYGEVFRFVDGFIYFCSDDGDRNNPEDVFVSHSDAVRTSEEENVELSIGVYLIENDAPVKKSKWNVT